jgi:hypothetical protein
MWKSKSIILSAIFPCWYCCSFSMLAFNECAESVWLPPTECVEIYESFFRSCTKSSEENIWRKFNRKNLIFDFPPSYTHREIGISSLMSAINLNFLLCRSHRCCHCCHSRWVYCTEREFIQITTKKCLKIKKRKVVWVGKDFSLNCHN